MESVHNCWNRIGVHGDKSCEQMKTHIHCRNCPAFRQGAQALLGRAPPEGYVEEWTGFLARDKEISDALNDAAMVFRIGNEWLALSARLCVEVVSERPIRRVPHRSGRILLGLTSVRGELLLCFSLARMLGLEPADNAAKNTAPRLLVVSSERFKPAFPVDEVLGIHRFNRESIKAIPATVAHAVPRFSHGVISVNSISAGLLDDATLFQTLVKELE